MMYFANPTNASRDHMAAGTIGYIDTPLQGNKRPAGVIWCADNGCFNDKRFTESGWYRWLQRNTHDADSCVFATAPDVLGDAAATLVRSAHWLPRIRALGYPAAYVAQDGSDQHSPPWDDFDVLFVGGTNTFKLGPTARQLIREAKQQGKWVHCGRVNSLRRYRAMQSKAYGCDSCDGTYLVFGPDTNLPKLLGWLRDLHDRPALDLEFT